MAKKKIIAKATKSIVKGAVNADTIRKDLLQARAELARLRKENENLKQQVKSLSTASAKQRQRIKSQIGQLKAAEVKVASLKKALIRTAKVAKTIAERTRKPKIAFGKAALSKEQVFEIYRGVNYNHFWERVESVIEPITQEDFALLNEAKLHMSSMSSEKIRMLIKLAGLRSTWYDSDPSWDAGELENYSVRDIHAIIMSY